MKLDRKQLRKLIESVVSERFGAYDVEDRIDYGDGDMMAPHNFEAAAKELYSQALDTVVDEFVQGHMDMITSGMAPETHDGYHTEVSNIAQDMKAELMSVIEKYSHEVMENL